MTAAPCRLSVVTDITRPEYWVECTTHDYKSEEFLSISGVNQALGEYTAAGCGYEDDDTPIGTTCACCDGCDDA